MSIKPRSKNFSNQEINSLVDLVMENKSKLIGAFSCTLSFEDKNNIWEEIAATITRDHGNIRNKDDVFKKWSNILIKYKPIISDKLASSKKTGGCQAEAGLTELELKIKSIKGKESFEGIAGGIDLSIESPISPLSEIEMAISPDAIANPSQSISESGNEIKPPRKRKFFEENSLAPDPLRQKILEREDEKLCILKSIDFKLDRLTGLLEQLVSNKLQMTNTPISMPPHPLSPFQASSSAHYLPGMLPNYFLYPDKD